MIPSFTQSNQEHAWLIAVPKRQEFTQPKFHFGERVKQSGEDSQGKWHCQTGRIIGMQFTVSQEWRYLIHLDDNSNRLAGSDSNCIYVEHELKLVKDSASVRVQLEPESEWLPTNPAASKLGVSAEQLRKLRRTGLFRVGHHCRDMSVPSSGLPRWQWHVERCGKALEVPPEKRSSRQISKS